MTVNQPDLDLLALWERGAALSPIDRSLALAEAVGQRRADLLEQPLGRTNRSLLDLRRRLLGDDLPVTARCPNCGERVEFAVAVAQFPDGGGPAAGEVEGARWRAPTPADLLAVAADPRPLDALRDRCVTGPATAEIEALMAQADPLAETLLDLQCPDCGAAFAADLDLGAFVWLEIEAAARRLLLQIDTLARTYGWTETEVLALPSARREAYLRMATGGLP